MFRKARFLFLVLVVSIITFSFSSISTLALSINTGFFNSNLTTGIVKCSTKFNNQTTLDFKPGDTVLSTLKVENIGTVDGICRVKIDKGFKKLETNEIETNLSADKIIINYNLNDWKEYNGFYYYTKALETGKVTSPLINSISLDNSADNSYKNKKIFITASTDVVQATGKGLEYFNVNAEDINYDEYTQSTISSDSLIELNDSSFNFNDTANNFFKSFSNISANEGRFQNITIKNISNTPSRINIKINSTKNENNILDEMIATVLLDDVSIYNGSFNDLENIDLGKFEVNQSKNLIINITSTSNIDNEKENSTATIVWNFSAQAVEIPTISTTEPIETTTVETTTEPIETTTVETTTEPIETTTVETPTEPIETTTVETTTEPTEQKETTITETEEIPSSKISTNDEIPYSPPIETTIQTGKNNIALIISFIIMLLSGVIMVVTINKRKEDNCEKNK